MDRLGEDVHLDPGPDREHAFVDRGGGIGAGHGRPDQLAAGPIDHDRDVPELGLDGIALGALREVGDQLERVEPGLAGALQAEPDERRLGIRVGRPGQRPVIGDDRLAERHPDGQLALVVALVRVELRAGRVADHPQSVGDAQPPVARERRPSAGVDAVVLEPEVVDREGAPDRQQDGVALGRRSVVELDHVGAIPAGAGTSANGANTGPHDHAVPLQRGPDRLGVARMVGRRQAWPRLDDRRRHAEPGVDLGELAAGRPAAEDEQASWQLAGERRLAVGPGGDVGDPFDAAAGANRTRRPR